MQAWPASLPSEVVVGDWELSPIDEREVLARDQGPDSPRRQYTNLKYSLASAIMMSAAQFQIFKGFFAGSISHGADRFTMPVFDGESYRSGLIVEFSRDESYSASDFAKGITKVSINLIVHNLPVDGITY